MTYNRIGLTDRYLITVDSEITPIIGVYHADTWLLDIDEAFHTLSVPSLEYLARELRRIQKQIIVDRTGCTVL